MSPAEVVSEFQKRRDETWRRAKIPALVMLVGFAVLLMFPKGHPESGAQFWTLAGAFSAVAAAIGYLAFTWKRLYRCPNCEAPVMNSLRRGGDVPLNPDSCPSCGAVLTTRSRRP